MGSLFFNFALQSQKIAISIVWDPSFFNSPWSLMKVSMSKLCNSRKNRRRGRREPSPSWRSGSQSQQRRGNTRGPRSCRGKTPRWMGRARSSPGLQISGIHYTATQQTRWHGRTLALIYWCCTSIISWADHTVRYDMYDIWCDMLLNLYCVCVF